jgi:hypothetical protein
MVAYSLVMEIWALEHKVIINIYYPIIQFIIGLAIIIIQSISTGQRKKYISEVQNRLFKEASDNNIKEELEKIQNFKIHIQSKYFTHFLEQQAWKGFGWGLVITSILLLLIIIQSDQYAI